MAKHHVQGLVEYDGKQGEIVASGRTEGVLKVAEMSGDNGAFGVGACEGLDGEITIFEGKAYVSRVRGEGLVMDNDPSAGAIFGAWTKNRRWQDEPVPAEIHTYYDLQLFVQTRATAAGIDTGATPFPFLMTGRPKQIRWHVNVDHTEGMPLTRDTFRQSKANYVTEHQEIDIVGFYSELHHGVFIGTYAPAIKDEGAENAMHIHLLSKDGNLTGHIDDLAFEGGMTLRLPR